MSRSRIILLVIVAMAVLADFLPVTRDEISWLWARAQNHSDDYVNYIGEWPKGRHVVEAKTAYDQRRWSEIKRAQIRQATTMAYMASPTNASTAADRRHELAVKKDNFFWKQTTNVNTVASYSNYLQQFPQGGHAAEARQKMATPGLPLDETNQPTPRL